MHTHVQVGQLIISSTKHSIDCPTGRFELERPYGPRQVFQLDPALPSLKRHVRRTTAKDAARINYQANTKRQSP